jgi:hypothetical protein
MYRKSPNSGTFLLYYTVYVNKLEAIVNHSFYISISLDTTLNYTL